MYVGVYEDKLSPRKKKKKNFCYNRSERAAPFSYDIRSETMTPRDAAITVIILAILLCLSLSEIVHLGKLKKMVSDDRSHRKYVRARPLQVPLPKNS